jgi:hypothetical protein
MVLSVTYGEAYPNVLQVLLMTSPTYCWAETTVPKYHSTMLTAKSLTKLAIVAIESARDSCGNLLAMMGLQQESVKRAQARLYKNPMQ